VARRFKKLLFVPVLVIAALTVKIVTWEEPPPIPPLPEAGAGLRCFRQGGDRDYCGCLDRLDSARAVAEQPSPGLPPFDDPVIRYALAHPGLYPIINGDTLSCLTPPARGVTARPRA
jgi:hypothetical protein